MTLARARATWSSSRRPAERTEQTSAERGGEHERWLALLIGLLAGAHTSTWGMYKDSPHEGFGWPRYFRSIVVSALAALAWQLAVGLDLDERRGRFVLFGLTYVTERGLVELWKTYLREEDQSKYFIPMQFHVIRRVIKSRRVRFTVAAGLVALVLGGRLGAPRAAALG